MPTKPIPHKDEFALGEILVEVYDPRPDSMNRVGFYAFWPDAKTAAEGGPPAGVRGQVYRCDLAEFTAEEERWGRTVRLWAPET